jgi:hypothetical protein
MDAIIDAEATVIPGIEPPREANALQRSMVDVIVNLSDDLNNRRRRRHSIIKLRASWNRYHNCYNAPWQGPMVHYCWKPGGGRCHQTDELAIEDMKLVKDEVFGRRRPRAPTMKDLTWVIWPMGERGKCGDPLSQTLPEPTRHHQTPEP